MKILGINISHDGSSCLLEDNEIKYLTDDERFNRIKHYAPGDSDGHLFESGKFKVAFAEELLKYTSHVDYIIFSSFQRFQEESDESNTDDVLIKGYLNSLKEFGITWGEVIFEEQNHHIYHASSGFYGSGFDEAVALILDGCGTIYQNYEDVEDLLGEGTRNCFREVESIFKVDYKSGITPLWRNFAWNESSIRSAEPQPRDVFAEKYGNNVLSSSLSCGMLFNLMATLLGFEDGRNAGKVMGMSSYYDDNQYFAYSEYPELDPRWWRKIDWFTEVDDTWVTTRELCEKLTDEQPFGHEDDSQEHSDFIINCDVANKLQEETLKHTKRLITKAVEISGCKNVVLSGGYFLNCLNNYQYLDIDPEINFYVDPVCYDGGTALGAAKWLYYKLTKSTEKNPLTSLYLS
nr:Predicted carbamoyl transferase, NodU family (COG2192) [uncultured Mediterranean phage uvMED]